MTTFSAIEFLIDSKSVNADTARKMIFEAYYNNRIDGIEYERLMMFADGKFGKQEG